MGGSVGVRVRSCWCALLIAVLGGAAAPSQAAGSEIPRAVCAQGTEAPDGREPLFTTASLPNNPFVPEELAPDQWLAKLHTEALGCAPEQQSYATLDEYVRERGCDQETLAEVAASVLTSPAFLGRGYDYPQRLLALWRIGRESEPDRALFDGQLAALRAGSSTWGETVDSFLAGPEFLPSVARLCSGQLYGWDPHRDVISIPTEHVARAFPGGGETKLQALLDASSPGETVWLDRGAVVRVSEGLVIPPGVTLATVGRPDPTLYLEMARLVRTQISGKPVVEVSPGATLASTWVDGQRSNQAVGMEHDSIDVHVPGGTETAVRDNRISNTAGWSTLLISPKDSGAGASEDVQVDGNLLTGYSTKFHWHETTGVVDGRVDTGTIEGQVRNFQNGQTGVSSTFGFADGISNSGEASIITDNEIVDLTDVGIVVFRSMSRPAPRQHSIVRGNVIVNAGNSAWAAFTVDPLFPPGRLDFGGTRISDNLVWTSPNAFLLMIAGIGTKPWFGDNTATGYGDLRFVRNTSGEVRVNTQMAIGVSRMEGVTVAENTLLAELAWADMCPQNAYIGVDESPGSKVQEPKRDVNFGSYPLPSDSRGCLILHF